MRDRPASQRTPIDTDLSRLTEALDREIRSLDTVEHVPPAPSSAVAVTAPAGAWATVAVAIGAAGVWLATSLPY